MAETSVFWNKLSPGDASIAPYNDTDIASYINLVLNSFVIPEYLNSLEVISSTPTVGAVTVKTGAAFVKGAYYTNDAAVSVAITAAVNNRYDRIVLRYSSAGQTVRVTKIIGAEAANPSVPAITASTDLPLAYVWVPAGYNPATTAINAEDVHDERLFKHIGLINQKYSSDDFVYNGDFMAFSQQGAGAVAPEGWRLSGAPTTIAASTYASVEKVRGHFVQVNTLGINTGIATTVRVPYTPPDPDTVYAPLDDTQTVYTIKGSIYITSGTVRVAVNGRIPGGAAATPVQVDFKHTGSEIIFFIRYVLPRATGVWYEALDITITSRTAPSNFMIGQIMAVHGWVPGHFRPKSEWIMYDGDSVDANWAATAKSTGTTVLNLTATFGNVIRRGTRAIIARLAANDSGSNGAGPFYLGLESDNANFSGLRGRADCGFLTNDTIREALSICPVAHNLNPPAVQANVVASGAGTLDATIQIIGIVT